MPKFKVDITRIGYGYTTIEIDASDVLAAREKAQETAGNYSYSEKTAEYEVGTAALIQPKEPYKFLMYMHVENDLGDMVITPLRMQTLDESEAFKMAASLYEMTPKMVCVEVLNTWGHVIFEQKVEHYVP